MIPKSSAGELRWFRTCSIIAGRPVGVPVAVEPSSIAQPSASKPSNSSPSMRLMSALPLHQPSSRQRQSVPQIRVLKFYGSEDLDLQS